MSLRELAKHRRRRRILEAARVLIGRGGMEELSMRRLAHQAQVSTRTLYNLYGAKEDILFALMSEAMASIEEIVQQGSEGDPLARSEAVTKFSLERLCQEEALYRNLIRDAKLEPGRSREPLLMAHMRSLHEAALRDALAAGQLREGFSPRVLAHQLVLSYGQGVRFWAHGVLDQPSLRVHALHSWALILLGASTGAARERLEARVAELHPAAERGIARLEAMFAGASKPQRGELSDPPAREPVAGVASVGSG